MLAASGREALQASPCLSKVKGLFERLLDLHSRIDRDALRVRRPDHVVFLCGGIISADEDNRIALSVRDYLYRIRKISSKLNGKIVLAEKAQQIYRESNYQDLISFEEDVARISSIVLVISESPGSLAELGAFSSEKVIQSALRVIISEDHNQSESFVRYGPIRRVENIDRERIGVFPWRNHKKNGALVKASIEPHYKEMIEFINSKISDISDSYLYRTIEGQSIFYDILWILSLLEAVPPAPLT